MKHVRTIGVTPERVLWLAVRRPHLTYRQIANLTGWSVPEVQTLLEA